MVVYQLAHQFLYRTWAMIVVVTVSLFQVVSWQASRFYVDVAIAYWQVLSLWVLVMIANQSKEKPLEKSTNVLAVIIMAGLFFGSSLATKLFSLFDIG